jgi:hypothetical protein
MKITNLGMASVIGMISVIGGIAINNILFPPQHEFDVPENDSLCTTHIVIQTPQKITDKETLRTFMLSEIEDLDFRFDVPDRNILITNLQDNKIKISFDGVLSEEDSGKKLAESLERHEFIESVLEQDGVRLVIKCQ